MKKILVMILAAMLAISVFVGCSSPAKEDAAATEAAKEEAAAPEEAEEQPDAAQEDAAQPAADEAEEATDEPEEDAAAADGDDSLQKIMDKGYFVMGLDYQFPPMGFKDETGELVGFDIDIARGVAEHMGIDVELKPINWTTKELELDSGNIDLIWNGYTITDERKEKVLMSAPYMENMQVILVKADSEVKTLADLSGKKVAVQEGSSAQEVLNADEALLNSLDDVKAFKDYVTALMDVDSGQVDALGVDLVVADYYMAKKPGEYVILEETLAPEEYGIGFRKGEQSFHDAVMAAFEEMKADGTAAEISNEWFGRDVTA